MVNLFPREVPMVLNLFPRELIEGTPMDFLRPDPKPLSTLRNFPRGSIHHDTPSAFPQIVPFSSKDCLSAGSIFVPGAT